MGRECFGEKERENQIKFWRQVTRQVKGLPSLPEAPIGEASSHRWGKPLGGMPSDGLRIAQQGLSVKGAGGRAWGWVWLRFWSFEHAQSSKDLKPVD